MRISIRIPLLAALALAACQGTPPNTSGFLGDYEGFKRNKHSKDGWVRYARNVELRDYDRLMIDKVTVVLSPGSDAAKLSADTLNKASAAFRRILVETVDPYYTVVDQPGPGVMRLRIALTDVRPAEGGKVGVAAMEVEAVDSVSGNQLAAAIDRIEGSDEGVEAPTEWRDVEGAFREWAQRLVDWMDRNTGG